MKIGTYRALARDQDGVVRADLDRTFEVVLGLASLVLLQVDRPQTVPIESMNSMLIFIECVPHQAG